MVLRRPISLLMVFGLTADPSFVSVNRLPPSIPTATSTNRFRDQAIPPTSVAAQQHILRKMPFMSELAENSGVLPYDRLSESNHSSQGADPLVQLMQSKPASYISERNETDISLVGGKGASLGELAQVDGIKTLEHFSVNTLAFKRFIQVNGLDGDINELEALSEQWIELEITKDASNVETNSAAQEVLNETIQALSKSIYDRMQTSEIPEEIKKAIQERYNQLARESGIENIPVAVRSSASAEDLPEASFAGMQETYLNQSGAASAINAVRNVWASFIGNYEKSEDKAPAFSNKSVFYRNQQRALLMLSNHYGRRFDDLDYKMRSEIVSEKPLSKDEAEELLARNQLFKSSKVHLSVVIQKWPILRSRVWCSRSTHRQALPSCGWRPITDWENRWSAARHLSTDGR